MTSLRTLKALYSLVRLVKDPCRLGEVFEMADALATPKSLQPVIDRLRPKPGVARALAERHRIRIDLVELEKLPKGTLGREFADHMRANNLDPSALPTLKSDTEHLYFRAHLYETHDIWHVVTGFGTDVRGELGLQGFYCAQIPGPLPGFLLAVGLLRGSIVDQDALFPYMDAMVEGFQMAKRAKPLFGVHWDDLWNVPLDELRARLNITPAQIDVALPRAA
jgi:ubiquinone biosynthesis protein COQ4